MGVHVVLQSSTGPMELVGVLCLATGLLPSPVAMVAMVAVGVR